MKKNTNPNETGLPGSLELMTKLGTVSVVVLYALGLLVTNVHLMGLGIADFSALQGRFVLSGLLFLFYAVLLLGLPAALGVGLWAAHKWFFKGLPRMWKLTAILLVALPLWTWLVILIYGSILSYLYPWGLSYESQWAEAFSFRAAFARTPMFLRLVKDAFLHAKSLAGLVPAYLLLAFGIVVRLARAKLDPASVDGESFRVTKYPFVLMIVFMGLTSITFMLFGYAQSVFPNLPYNLGGGQPRIIQLHMRPSDSLLLGTSGLAMEDAKGGPLVSVPLALWHQDATFMYVTPASSQKVGAARLTAITAQSVEVVEYLSGYVKVTSGSQIEDAHVDQLVPRP